jgi:hypothetical protein
VVVINKVQQIRACPVLACPPGSLASAQETIQRSQHIRYHEVESSRPQHCIYIDLARLARRAGVRAALSVPVSCAGRAPAHWDRTRISYQGRARKAERAGAGRTSGRRGKTRVTLPLLELEPTFVTVPVSAPTSGASMIVTASSASRVPAPDRPISAPRRAAGACDKRSLGWP